MAFPMFTDNFGSMEVGEKIDLGGIEFITAEPVVRDIRTSLWGFIHPQRILFPGDGFAYSHYHWDGHVENLQKKQRSLNLFEVTSVFAELALFWTNFVDMNIYSEKAYKAYKRTKCTMHLLNTWITNYEC